MGCTLLPYRASGNQGLEQTMTANEILRELEMTLGTARKADVLAAFRAADDFGTIGPMDAMKLFGPSEPTKHTYMQIRTALIYLGCRDS